MKEYSNLMLKTSYKLDLPSHSILMDKLTLKENVSEDLTIETVKLLVFVDKSYMGSVKDTRINLMCC